MTDDLKTKIAEAINALPFADGMISYNVVQAALQAIHDAGCEINAAGTKAALQPFAEACEDADDNAAHDSTSAWESSMACAVTFGDFRRAAAIQAAQPNTEEKT